MRTIPASGGVGNAAAIVESSPGSPGRFGCRRARRGRKRSVQADETRDRKDGLQSRPLARDDINIGMVEELPLGNPLETPLHPKRRITLAKDRDHFKRSGYNQASTSTAHVLPVTPPTAHVERKMTTTPKAARTSQTCRRPQKRRLDGDNKICSYNYGSEEEKESDAASDNECEAPISIPRSVRVLLATAEDIPQEAEATDRVETPSVEFEESAQNGERMHEPTSLFHFEWQGFPTPPIPPQLRREKFVGKCGPMIDAISSPYEAFLLIWDRPIMEHIAFQTNLYAQQYAEQLFEQGQMGPTSRISRWTDTNVDELYVYFALVMAMGILIKPSIYDYWINDKSMFATPAFSINMNLKRFQLLSKCLHFNNNSTISANTVTHYQAKLYKIGPIVDHLNIKFSSLFGLGQNIALDESLTQWKGWLDINQFIPNKAAKVGIKTYEVCDSKTGYLWRFECHTGDQNEVQQVISGSTPNLVLRLLRGLENRGHTVWMDNSYNSPSLARILKSIGYDCVGTLRTNSRFVPKQITYLKKDDMRMGQVCGCTSGDVDLMVWRDQNRVAMISTYHGTGVSDGKPIVVRDYNVCIGGVDKKDQMLSSYPMERKRTLVWYKKFFRRLLNVSILNAYILYKHTHKTTHGEFRRDLVQDLIKRHRAPLPLINLGTHRVLSDEVMQHFPSSLPVIPNSAKHGRYRRLCVYCKQKRTVFVCRGCDVSLCADFTKPEEEVCFLHYHKTSHGPVGNPAGSAFPFTTFNTRRANGQTEQHKSREGK